MSPEAQRIAIAEACGWRGIFIAGDNTPEGFRPGDTRPFKFTIPDYLTDLNAMNAAELTLTGRAREVYAYYLFNLAGPNEKDVGEVYPPGDYIGYLEEDAVLAFFTYTSSAARRAEAFLRAAGKWDTTK